MKPMDQAYIEERDIANRYMQGKLCAEECEEFEIFLMENSDMVDKLNIDSMFIKALPFITNKTVQKPAFTFWKSLFATPIRASLGTACACALVFAFVSKTNLLPPVNETLNSPSLIYVSSIRGNTTQVDASLYLSDISDSVSLVVQDDFELGHEYQINMFASANDSAIHSATYLPNSDQEIVVLINKDMLQPGLLEIQYSLNTSNQKSKSLVVSVRD